MCTSIGAGHGATADGTILFARNEDCVRANWNKAMRVRNVPEYMALPQHANQGRWTLANGLTVDVPKAHYSYTGMPDAAGTRERGNITGSDFFFEERGVNSANFGISATNSMTSNKAAQKADPFVPHGLAECILPTLLLSQCASAEEALDRLAQYMAQTGASEANGLYLSDPLACWYVEIGSGHHWIAVRIPDDQYIAVANGMRIHGIDLSDKENVRASEGIFEFTQAHLLPEARHDAFDFARAFDAPMSRYNTDRIWLAQHLLTPSLRQEPGNHQYPLFLKPDVPITPQAVMNLLRAGYAGTVLEAEGKRPIGFFRTGESHVITLDPNAPDPLKGMIWQAVSSPLCAPYLPFFAAARDVPPEYAAGSDSYDARSAYWAFRGLHVLALAAGHDAVAAQAAKWHELERQGLEDMRALQVTLTALLADDVALEAFMRRYTSGMARDALAQAFADRDHLMTGLTYEDGL